MKLLTIPQVEEVNYTPKSFMSRDTSFTKIQSDNEEIDNLKIVYRKNGKSIDKIHEFDTKTNSKIKTTYYDYFDDNKIRSINEYHIETGKKIRTTNFVLYKSVDEFDLETGKKIRSINYDMKDENKVASIHEYDLVYQKIVKISIFRRDGKTVSIVKEINPETEQVTKWISYKEDSKNVNTSVKTKYFYDESQTADKIYIQNKTKDNKISLMDYKKLSKLDDNDKERMGKLIDNLYRKKIKFDNI